MASLGASLLESPLAEQLVRGPDHMAPPHKQPRLKIRAECEAGCVLWCRSGETQVAPVAVSRLTNWQQETEGSTSPKHQSVSSFPSFLLIRVCSICSRPEHSEAVFWFWPVNYTDTLYRLAGFLLHLSRPARHGSGTGLANSICQGQQLTWAVHPESC